MDTIIILGDEDDKEIYTLFKAYFGDRCTAESKFEICVSAAPDMLIIEKSSLFDIYAEKGIVIFKNSCNLKQIRTLPGSLIAVFDSKNAAVRNFLMGRSISAVSCGLGTGDTLNISGIGDDAAVSLQRELATLDGELNLPQELVVKNIGALSEFSVMSLCAVLLLTRKSDGLSIDLNFH